jgi:O-antigen/teichoic acid export membrane protein
VLAKRLLQQNRLLNVFASQVGSHVGGALLGLVFWMLAARTLTPEQLGLGAALVAAMTLLSEFGLLGVDTLLLERLKSVAVTDRRAILTTGLAIAAIGGVLVTTVWLGISALLRLSGTLGDLSLSTGLLLGGATAIAAVCFAFDQAAIGMGASSVQLRRNILASCLRIGFLLGAIALDFRSGQVILVSWIVGLAGSLLASRIRRHVLPKAEVTPRRRWDLVRTYWSTAVGHQGLTLAMGAGSLMLPVVVASMMPAAQTAYFSQARLLSDTALALPFFLTIALFATVQDLEGFRHKARRTILIGMVLTLCVIAAAALVGRYVLLLFGAEYAQASLPLLMLLLAAGPLLVIKDHFAVLRRLQGKRVPGAVAMALWTAAELTGAVIGGLSGSPTMLCLGWLVMSAACALIALPALLEATRKPRDLHRDGRGPDPEGAGKSSGVSAAVEADRALADFWTLYVEAGREGIQYIFRDPLRSFRVLRGIRNLPVVRAARPSDQPGGRAVRRILDLRGPYGVPARWWGSAALAVPADASEHVEGPRAQTLRRKIRAAERHGISCRPVQRADRIGLLARANAVEQTHHDEQYRVLTPRNDDLLEHDLWMVAEDGAGEPLLLAVIPVDGELATLRYFRTLGGGDLYSLSRYFATHALVAELSKRGVRWLLDTEPPGAQKNGVRHFQRMVGFRYVRLRVASRDDQDDQVAALPDLPPTDEKSCAADEATESATKSSHSVVSRAHDETCSDKPTTLDPRRVGHEMQATP